MALLWRPFRGVPRRPAIGSLVIIAIFAAANAFVHSRWESLIELAGPGRTGTGSFLWFDRAFPDLNIELAGTEYDGRALRVAVLLYFADQRTGHCFIVPDDMRVAINGHPLEVSHPGRENPIGPGRTGIDYSGLFPCVTASFSSATAEPIELTGPARVTIDLGSKHAELTSATFLGTEPVPDPAGSTYTRVDSCLGLHRCYAQIPSRKFVPAKHGSVR